MSKTATTINNCQSDDHILFHQVQQNDTSAFNILFEKYYYYLCNLSQKVLKNNELAKEVVSDVFLKIWLQRETLHIHTSIKAFLTTSVRNLSIDYWRKESQHRNILDISGIENNFVIVSSEENIIYYETAYIIEQAIERLPPQGKIIFQMSREEGLKYREIAETLNISIKTVETHMRRNFILLRERVGHQANGRAA
jgi:RNA polymerase sigma-70 factor (ECF subfamily)